MILAILAAAALGTSGVVVGPGAGKCAVAMRPENQKRSFDYIWGVWTGMNMASNEPVGSTTDAHGILLEVVKVCTIAPDFPLAVAVLTAHMKMQNDKR